MLSRGGIMKKLNILILTLVLLLGVVAGVLLNSIPSSVKASYLESNNRLEYCAIDDVAEFGKDEKSFAVASICYFQNTGCHRVSIEASLNGMDKFAEAKAAALAKAISKLSSEGWEIVGEATRFEVNREGFDRKSLYFKRNVKN
jgi:hypothetical protein